MRYLLLLTLLLLGVSGFSGTRAYAQFEAATSPAAVDDAACLPDESELPVARFRKQALQTVAVTGGYLGSMNGDLDQSFMEISVKTGIPLGNFDNILGVSPSFRTDFIGPVSELGTDVPAELFDAGATFFYRRSMTERMSLMGIIRPSIRSDFTTSDNAFRLFGLGLVNWECVPGELTLSAGAVFLDRADLPLLPAAGLTWTPEPTFRADLQFPTSKAAWRIAKNGAQSETWSYVAAGIGGNTWAVTRASGLSDELSLRDVRIVLGVDHLTDGGGGWFGEFGYVFARRLEYESDDSKFDLSDGALIQAGWRY